MNFRQLKIIIEQAEESVLHSEGAQISNMLLVDQGTDTEYIEFTLKTVHNDYLKRKFPTSHAIDIGDLI